MDLKEHFKPTALKLAVIGVLALLTVIYLIQMPSYMQSRGEWEYEQKVLSEQSLELTRAIENGGSLSDEQILEKNQERENLNQNERTNSIEQFYQLSSSASILNSIMQYTIPLPLFPLACQNNRPYGCFDYMSQETFKKLLPTEEEINKMPVDAILFGAITSAKSVRDYKPFNLPKAILQTMGLAAMIYVLLSLLSTLFAWIDLRETKQKALVIGIALFLVVLPWILSSFGIRKYLDILFILAIAFTIILIIFIALKTQRRRTIFYWIVLSLFVAAIIAVPILGRYYYESRIQQAITLNMPPEQAYIITPCNDINPIEGATKCTNCGKACTDACKAEGKGRVATLNIKGENPRCACACFKSAVKAESKTTAISDITGNLVKIPFLKNAIKKTNAAQQTASSAMPSSGGDTAINNRKRSDRYYGKQVFLVSDRDWHNVLSIVPVAMWHEGSELKKYPVLIYHEEEGGFDADSVFFFLNQYNAKKVVLVGDTPEELDNILIADGYTYLLEAEVALAPLLPVTGRPIAEIPGILPPGAEAARTPIRGIDLTPDWLTRISPDDYTRHWITYNTVVVCEDNYQLGLLASVYAAYINAPLFFEGRIPAGIDLSGKRVITVGRTSYTGVERYTLEQLERRLLEMYPTDKIILANPNDLTIRLTKEIPQPYTTLVNGAEIEETYSKTSLLAPFLAVGKNEFLLTTGNTEVSEVKADITAKIAMYGLKPKYLTIMASPPAIQMEIFSDDWDWYEEVDNHIYGDIDSDGFQDLAVGRIFTLTPSDVSAYVARDLFIEYIGKSNNFASLWPNYFSDMKVDGKSADREMRSAGYNDNSVYLEGAVRGLNAERDLKNKVYIAYLDHGYYAGWGEGINTYYLRTNYTKMKPSIVLSNACLTCAYTATYSYANTNDLFCSNLIKHGAMAHIGAVASTGGSIAFSQVIVDELLHGKDIGQAFLKFRKISEINYRLYSLAFGTTESTYNHHYILLGDPTLKIIPASPTIVEETQMEIENLGSMQKVNIHFNQPSEEVNYILIPDEEGFGGYERYLVYPAGNVHVNGQRRISFQYEPSPPVMSSLLKDDLYWEMEGSYLITGINFKIRYSDGSERNLPLNKRGDFYYYEYSHGYSFYNVYLLPLQVNGGYKIMMVYMETLELNKIIPSYDYEIEMQTTSLLSPIRTSVEAMHI
ncbi:MAG TPA: hypothetical protein HA362_03645 [Nanoarchaeota archaeon]|nr:hypothetical protein [Nanoarchaeota archaeon]